ncbi:hypothetical protein SDC9_182161 [bioreactor metagenome]|uniref:Uncharacterized protein n=1 Tax=bioreactor metagenome TaxID=1076179 RepID=A0A645H6L2_9ZZZZ
MASPSWVKMSCTKPPARISPDTPKAMATRVIAVRTVWRKMLRSASLSSMGLPLMAQGVDNVHACGFPGRQDAGDQGRDEGQQESVEGKCR